MKTVQDNTKTTGKSGSAPVIRMGREVPSQKAASCDSGNDTKCVEKKEKARADRESENKASSLV